MAQRRGHEHAGVCDLLGQHHLANENMSGYCTAGAVLFPLGGAVCRGTLGEQHGQAQAESRSITKTRGALP
ncbi:MAG: hypothetical protein M0008_04465 [Actinomycetota bacterium]|nr:hypothetical protein [Actinomycetota bacterium]